MLTADHTPKPVTVNDSSLRVMICLPYLERTLPTVSVLSAMQEHVVEGEPVTMRSGASVHLLADVQVRPEGPERSRQTALSTEISTAAFFDDSSTTADAIVRCRHSSPGPAHIPHHPVPRSSGALCSPCQRSLPIFL